MKFKTGDIVRCITETYPTSGYRKGECYEVLDTYNDGQRIHTVLDSNGSTTNGWGVHNFELASPKTCVAATVVHGGTSRAFETGATRDLDDNKLDFEGFLSPLVIERYAEHMHVARKMPDGTMRSSDNWQLGIPLTVYMKSMWRHFFAVWKLHRGLKVTEVVRGETIVKDIETELCALRFNVDGMLHEILKAKRPEWPAPGSLG
jgi:hypothetical protein